MLTASRGLEDALAVSARTAPAAIAPAVTALARPDVGAGRHRGGAAGLRRRDRRPGRRPDRRGAAHRHRAARRRRARRAQRARRATRAGRRGAPGNRGRAAPSTGRRCAGSWRLSLASPRSPLWTDPTRRRSAPSSGKWCSPLVAVLYAAGLVWLHKLGQIPVPGRFLADPAGRPTSPIWQPSACRRPAGTGGWSAGELHRHRRRHPARARRLRRGQPVHPAVAATARRGPRQDPTPAGRKSPLRPTRYQLRSLGQRLRRPCPGCRCLPPTWRCSARTGNSG